MRQAQPRSRGRESRRDLLLVHLRQVEEAAHVRRQPHGDELQAAGVDGPRDGAEVLLRMQAERVETVLRWHTHQDAGRRGGQVLFFGPIQGGGGGAGAGGESGCEYRRRSQGKHRHFGRGAQEFLFFH